MARIPRQLARRGVAADLPDATSYDAHVGADGELTADLVRGRLNLHNGVTPGGNRIAFLADLPSDGPSVLPMPGRLTLVSGVPVTVSDVAGATSIYYAQTSGAQVSIYDGAGWILRTPGELALALDANGAHAGYHEANKNFDLFVFLDGLTLRFGSGPPWNAGAVAGSDTARGTGAGSTELESLQGLMVNKNAIDLRFGAGSGDIISVPARRATYVGSARMTANGQASDTRRRRLLFNAYNQTLRPLRASEPAVSWVYSATPFVQANGNANNEVEVLCGLVGGLVDLSASCIATSSVFPGQIQTAIGVDGVTPSPDSLTGYESVSLSGAVVQPVARYVGHPGLGKHALKWLVAAHGSGVQTFQGSNSDTVNFKIGLVGLMLG